MAGFRGSPHHYSKILANDVGMEAGRLFIHFGGADFKKRADSLGACFTGDWWEVWGKAEGSGQILFLDKLHIQMHPPSVTETRMGPGVKGDPSSQTDRGEGLPDTTAPHPTQV